MESRRINCRALVGAVSAAAISVALAGCVSGGGYSPHAPSVPGNPDVPEFTSISDLKPGGRTTLRGPAVYLGYEYDLEASEGDDPMEYGEPGFSASAAVEVEIDEAGAVTGLTTYGPGASRTWGGGDFNASGDGYLRGLSEGVDGGHSLLAAAHEYQAFGAWATGTGNAEAGGIGAFSAGANTDAARIPGSGSAVFLGRAASAHVSQDGVHSHVTASAALEADFAGRTAHFRTYGSMAEDPGGSATAAPGLDVDGLMSWGHDGMMTGTAVSHDGMEGVIDGRFFGPSAQEAGGTFLLSGNGSAMAGAYGAER